MRMKDKTLTIARSLPNKSTPPTRDMLLEGKEAMKLYVAEIGRKIDALGKQIDLLQEAFTERKQLLREIDCRHVLRL